MTIKLDVNERNRLWKGLYDKFVQGGWPPIMAGVLVDVIFGHLHIELE